MTDEQFEKLMDKLSDIEDLLTTKDPATALDSIEAAVQGVRSAVLVLNETVEEKLK